MFLLPAILLMNAAPEFQTFNAPGYDAPVSGVWYDGEQARSAMPLGALGTGFVDLRSDGRFGDHTTENNWLHPIPVGEKSGLTITVGDKTIDLTQPSDAVVEDMRFWGHFPAADVSFGGAFAPVELLLRALAPLIPHDYERSQLPVAIFHFTVKNTGQQPVPVEVGLQWNLGQVPAETTKPTVTALSSGIMIGIRGGTYALGAQSSGWHIVSDSIDDEIARVRARSILKPGELSDVVLALAWHFPTWDSSDGESLRHRYATTYRDAGEVLAKALPEAAAIEKAIIDWQSKVYASNAPPSLKDAVINSLYVLARNTWWMDDGRFFQSESFTGCPITETLVCRFNGSFPLALLFPECEKATMREFAKHQSETGQIAFGFGTPAGTKTPMFNLQVPIVSSEYALLVWRNYAMWKDDAYLAEAYPSMKRAIQFAMTLDKDGDGLINEAPGSESGFPANQYYDIWPWWGTSAYTASIWLAAVKAGIAAATKQGDQPFANELQAWLDRGAAAYNDKLWTGSYYRLYNDPDGHGASETSLTNALCGQWFAYASGLGEFLPHDRINAVIDTVLRLNAKATSYGAVNGVRSDGSVDESFADHSAVITIGEVWNFCAMAAFAGRQKDALSLFETSYENVALRQRTPWNIPWSLDRTTGAIKWGINYYSNPCVWTLFQAVESDDYSSLDRGRS